MHVNLLMHKRKRRLHVNLLLHLPGPLGTMVQAQSYTFRTLTRGSPSPRMTTDVGGAEHDE